MFCRSYFTISGLSRPHMWDPTDEKNMDLVSALISYLDILKRGLTVEFPKVQSWLQQASGSSISHGSPPGVQVPSSKGSSQMAYVHINLVFLFYPSMGPTTYDIAFLGDAVLAAARGFSARFSDRGTSYSRWEWADIWLFKA